MSRSTPTFAAGLAAAILALASTAAAQETERLMLSGNSRDDAVLWEFSVTGGRRAGEAATIPVPSQWEQHGFGSYNYGHDDDKSREQGRYRYRFEVPAQWRGKTVDLVFEGVMTDAEVQLNGRSAGPVHQGGFYRFRYDVSDLLRPGENLLEVTVSKHSAEKSVNRAERDADYWVFGGIYRPVYLEARPPESMDHVAIDARHEGRLTIHLRLRGVAEPARVTARVETPGGEPIGAPFSAQVGEAQSEVELGASFDGVRPWSAESPQLYRLVLELERGGQVPPEAGQRSTSPEAGQRNTSPEAGQRSTSPEAGQRSTSPEAGQRSTSPEAGQRNIVHRHAARFGFRTIDPRGDGLKVNGRRVLLKGVNRHAFWPPSGRAGSRELDFRDAELIKSMNMNAVRTSHYPPDPSFLEACDELGLYVIDELAGWHDAYATTVGRRLVREMVERDVNHPSVILWANGNEDGWNEALDEVFAEHDPQRRTVIHPRSTFGRFDADHYPSWTQLEASLDPATLKNRWRSLFGALPLVMPTELLHGLYDGGSGAGLEDYWQRLRASPRAAGAFLWSFSDEAVERTDRGGALDTDGNHAPDGILGPYRELTGNYLAVREVFSPVRIADRGRFTGSVEVENRFDMIDLSQCRFDWSLLALPPPGGGKIEDLATGTLPGPGVPPGDRGELSLPPAVDWRSAGAVRLTAGDPSGRELMSWVLPIRDPRHDLSSAVAVAGEPIEAAESGGRLTLRSTSLTAEFDLGTGRLLALSRAGSTEAVPLAGPLSAAGGKAEAAFVRHFPRDGAYAVDARGGGGLAFAHWLFLPSGWLRLSYAFEAEGAKDFFGIRFDLDEDPVENFRWLGDGPARVWKNRLRGGTLGLWEKCGESTSTLAGYYSGVVWAELATAESRLLIALESSVPPEGGQPNTRYLGLFSPDFPGDARDAVATVPPGGVSLLHGISAIGTKFHPPEDLGPQSQQAVASGLYRGVVWFHVLPRGMGSSADQP